MPAISFEQISDSVYNALQYISCYHSADFIDAMYAAYQAERSQTAKDAIAQILINSRLAALGKRPICQDTGMAVIYADIGMHIEWDTAFEIDDAINEGVARAYNDINNPLRASVIEDPLGERNNTKNNTPAVIHHHLSNSNRLQLRIAAKGFGSENKTQLAMLKPSDDIISWVCKTVEHMGAGWCPPGILGIGVGGTAEKACSLAKESLLDAIDMPQLLARGAQNNTEQLRIDLFHAINNLGIGAQGLGGTQTVLDVKINEYPTHAAAMPICLIPNCVATRHISCTLDGSAAAQFAAPDIDRWPVISSEHINQAKRINVDTLQKSDLKDWNIGDTFLLSGHIITARDAAHKRLCQFIAEGKALPCDLNNKLIYYCGPVPKTGDEIIGPAGPTTATRMDPFTDVLLEHAGILGMIGKGERSRACCESIAKCESAYFIAVGGAAYHISQAIQSSRIIAFEDLGMEAIHEFEVKDMPVTLAVNGQGQSIHEHGPQQWKQ